MGRPKASLEVEGETFLQRAVNTLMAGGCADVVIVIDPDHPAGPERAFEGGVRSAAGSGSGSEQIDSLRSGLRATSASAEAAVVMPVDHPLVRPETVAALIAAFAEGGGEALIVRPTFQGKHGHPVLFSAALFCSTRSSNASLSRRASRTSTSRPGGPEGDRRLRFRSIWASRQRS